MQTIKKLFKIYLFFITISVVGIVVATASRWEHTESYELPTDDVFFQRPDSSGLKVPMKEGKGTSPLHLKDPPNVKTEAEYNPSTNDYTITRKVGDVVIERKTLSFKDYQDQEMDKTMSNYWNERAKASGMNSTQNNLLEKYIPGLSGISSKVESFIGIGIGDIEVRPTGSAEVIFSIINNKRDDPAIDVRKRSVTSFDFDQNIQLNVNAKIGDQIGFDFNYNTEAIFSFENKLKLKYEGKEDDILQLLEAGDVQLTLPSSLIRGSQSLFGVKAKLKFGKTTFEAIASQQKSESKNIVVEGGALTEPFYFKADEYEENRHYFLSQYFYDNYNAAMASLPIINSNIKITKIEVWRTNIGGAVTQNRNVIAYADAGESNPNMGTMRRPGGSVLPDNDLSNDLFRNVDKNAVRNINNVSTYLQGKGFVSGQDYEKVENARRLLEGSEFTYNDRLGFISVNQALAADQVLAVAFQYQKLGDSTIYQVGEFSDEGITDPNVLNVKLLKSTTINTKLPTWKLMMKNVYYLKSNQISQEDFRLNILYEGDAAGVPSGYFTEGNNNVKGIPLIQVFGLDQLDFQMNPGADGVFDFIDGAATGGGRIQASTGRVYFPTVEPFGKDLRAKINDPVLANKYCFDSLYSKTKIQAQQYPDKNKYYLEGYYKSAMGGEISLGMSVPQGSVKVTAGGIPLIENVDYSVDYVMGKVRILNEGILNSGTPINITNENNSLFSVVTKTMIGLRVNHEFNKNFNIGATVLNLREGNPVKQKTIFGDEPISNTVFGFDMQYQHDVPFITKLIDALPGIQTKAPSTFTFNGEFAYFLSGITKTTKETGTSYVDDFEAARTNYNLMGESYWHIASTPQDYSSSSPLFPETANGTELKYGFNRANLAWYRIDNLFYERNAPKSISKDDQSSPYARRIYETEVFPAKEIPAGEVTYLREMNLAFYPTEKGPYNYDAIGIGSNGELNNPKSRWGGIMRKLDATDFEAQNIEYIQFWVMDPFIEDPNHSGGKLYFNLGDISEDILRDGRKSFENGLPTSAEVKDIDTTIWGRVPKLQPIVNAFDNDPASRKYQDVGLDGLNSGDEASFFNTYLEQLKLLVSEEAYQNALKDPSNDNFHYFRGSDYDNQGVSINDRYKYYNNPEGNATTSENSPEDYSTQGSSTPDIEDINKDNTLSEAENYYEYVVDLKPGNMVIGKNYITDIYTAENISLPNGQKTSCTWYQFKIPVHNPDRVVGSIESFQSVRFMRMFMRGFEEPVILRFASLDMVRSEWRKYNGDLLSEGDYVPGQSTNSVFNIATVNIEENGTRNPVPYVMPPGVERERYYSSTSYYQGNEQSLSLHVENLADGDAKAIYKNTAYDFRFFKKLKMYVHGEKVFENDNVTDGDITVFVRLGSDFSKNYYEYEVPLKYTPWYTSGSDASTIWPKENEVEIDFDRLVKVKENRNRQIRGGSTNYNLFLPYTEYEGEKKMTVVGSPSISNVKTVMIGIRNPKKQTLNDGDDMNPKSAEIWVNELRLTDFSNEGGWAATALARTTLADLGDLSLYGAYTSSGYGSLDQRIADLNTEDISTIDVSTNLELGKFLPEKSGIKIPFHFDHSNTNASPKYNPMDPDVKLEDDLTTYATESMRDSIRSLVDDMTTRTNINFMNVRKERTGKRAAKPRFYQIENFDLSYSYSIIHHRNIDIEYNTKEQQKASIGYNYSKTAKSLKPFAKIPALKNNGFAIIRDFELFYQPKNLTLRSDFFRDYQEDKMRDKSIGAIIIQPTYFKQFYWNRQYNIVYDLTSNIQLQYNAVANARIDEPRGSVDTSDYWRKVWRENINTNEFKFGDVEQFDQKIDATWNIPINKIPYMEWMRPTASYGVNYRYAGATSVVLDSVGNTIQSTNHINLTVNLTLASLYNKIGFIKNAYNPPKPKPQEPKPPVDKKDKKDKKDAKDSTQVEEDLGPSAAQIAMENILNFSIRLLTSVKTLSVTYDQTTGLTLPGFMPEAKVLGMDIEKGWAPGLAFVTGLSDESIIQKSIDNGWISTDYRMNMPFQKQFTESIRGQATLEPIKDMRITLTFDRTYSENIATYYIYELDSVSNSSRFSKPMNSSRSGAFSITTWAFASAFTSDNKDNSNKIFQEFLNNRDLISQRLGQQNNNSIGTEIDTNTGKAYPKGYNSTSQQVLIPAFLAAYLGKDPKSISFNPFLSLPMPNWQVTYNGLNKIKMLQQWFSNVAISNGYRSTYAIGSFYMDARVPLNQYDYGSENIEYISGNFIPKDVIDQITISEQFSPLIKIDVTLKNSFQVTTEYRKDRSLSLSFSNNQLTDVSRNTFAVGLGYRFKEVPLSFLSSGGPMNFNTKSDIILKGDISWSDNKTVLRKIDQPVNQISSGSQVFALGLSGEYALSAKLVAKLFFKTNINTPFISNSVPNSTTSGGISIRFTL